MEMTTRWARRCQETFKNRLPLQAVAVNSSPTNQPVMDPRPVTAGDDGASTVIEFFVKLPGVTQILKQRDTKSSVLFKDGMQIDLRVVTKEQYPFALHYFTDSKEHNIAMRQRPDGSWTGWAPRPPISGGDIRETALSVYALERYSPPGRRAEFNRRIERARSYLLQEKPANPEEAIMRLMGLTWAKTDAGELRKVAAEVLAAQRADGGWAQLTTRDSDALATGEALVALRESGVLKPDSEAYQRGVKYLLRTQLSDGSWLVKTRSYPFQQLVDSGFPHGRDQWISASGTGWALLALMPAA